jgi:hypothetical protein
MLINLSLFLPAAMILKGFSGKGMIIEVIYDISIVEYLRIIVFSVAVFALQTHKWTHFLEMLSK